MTNEEMDEKVGAAVRVQDGDFAWYAPASATNLTDDEKFARLSKEQKNEIFTTSKTVADFYEARNETPVDGMDALIQVSEFLERYKDAVAETESARKILAVRCLADGVEPAEVQALVGVNFATLASWCAPKYRGVTTKKVDQKVLASITKAGKDAKAAKSRS